MDSFLMIRLHSMALFLERREHRVVQFRLVVSKVGESDQRFVHSLAANFWTDFSLSERVAEEMGSHTQLQESSIRAL